MRLPAWLVSALLVLSWHTTAAAVGVGSADGPLRVREDYALVVVDGGREHVVYAARLELDARPASPTDVRAVVALPTFGRPEVQPLPALDLPAALHALAAGYERRVLGRRSAPPAPWPRGGVAVGGRALDLAEQAPPPPPLDGGWLRAVGATRGWLALLDVTADGLRGEELSTPAVRISFDANRPGLVVREPPLADKVPRDDEAGSAASREPFAVEDVVIPPAPGAPSTETVTRVLRTRTAPVRACYDAYAKERSGAEATVRVQVVIDRRGETESATPVGEARGDAAATTLARCVSAAVRAKSFPRIERGWRFMASIRFKPPPAPSRRTHLFLLGRERLRWSAPPVGVSLARELEVEPTDLEQAFDADLRRALGLGGEVPRLWLTEYLDTAERRHDRADLVVERAPLPRDGEPGTRAFAPAAEAPSPSAEAAPPARAGGRRGRHRSLIHAGVLLLVVAAAVALAFSQET